MEKEEQSEELDLRAQLEADYDSASTEEITEPVDPVESVDEPETEEAKAARTRDEKGRFVSAKERAGEINAEAKESAEPIAQDFQPPWDIPKELKEQFSKLAPEQKKIVLDVYSGFDGWRNQTKAELDRKHQEMHSITSVIEQNRDAWALRGVSPSQVIAQAAAFDRLLLQDPKAAIRSLAESNGVDLNSLLEETPYVDPATQHIMRELQELRQWRQQQEQQGYQSHITNVSSEIESFASETDQSGKLAHPHFQEVYSDMLPIVQAMKQAEPTKPARTILQEAYDRAVWGNPQTRAALIQAQEAKRIDEQKEKAAASRRAGTQLNGAAGPALSQAMPSDLRGQLEAGWDNLFN